MKIRDQKTKEQFIEYLKENPQLRFWQSIRNFSGAAFVYVGEHPSSDPELRDTFYMEENNGTLQKYPTPKN